MQDDMKKDKDEEHEKLKDQYWYLSCAFLGFSAICAYFDWLFLALIFLIAAYLLDFVQLWM